MISGNGKKDRTSIRRDRHGAKRKPEESDLPVSMGKLHGGDKDYSYPYVKYGTMEKILKRHVGRPWDLVFSEICKNADIRSHNGYLIRNSVAYHVETNIEMVNGEPRRKEHHRYVGFRTLGPNELYVNPDTGLLCVTPQKTPNRKVERKNNKSTDKIRKIDKKNPLIQYHLINGIWYRIDLREPTQDEKNNGSFGYYEYTKLEFVGSSTPSGKRWKKIWGNAICESINEASRYVDGYRRSTDLWHLCKILFGGNYLPVRKTQISTKEIRRIIGNQQ